MLHLLEFLTIKHPGGEEKRITSDISVLRWVLNTPGGEKWYQGFSFKGQAYNSSIPLQDIAFRSQEWPSFEFVDAIFGHSKKLRPSLEYSKTKYSTIGVVENKWYTRVYNNGNLLKDGEEFDLKIEIDSLLCNWSFEDKDKGLVIGWGRIALGAVWMKAIDIVVHEEEDSQIRNVYVNNERSGLGYAFLIEVGIIPKSGFYHHIIIMAKQSKVVHEAKMGGDFGWTIGNEIIRITPYIGGYFWSIEVEEQDCYEGLESELAYSVGVLCEARF